MRVIVPVLAAVAALGAGGVAYQAQSSGQHAGPSASARPVSATAEEPPAATAIERFERSIQAKAGSRRSLGELRVAGRSVRLYSVETTTGKSCLVDEDPRVGPSAGCLDGELFDARRAAFSVNTTGGPGRYDELYLIGVAAPGVGAVALVKSDGSSVRLRLTRDRAFVFESPASELAARIHPSALRLFTPGGRLIEVIDFPAAS
jgi:hypothetical protein